MQFSAKVKNISSSQRKAPTLVLMNSAKQNTNMGISGKLQPRAGEHESGSVAVEAAVGIPFFLGIMFTAIQLLWFCFQLLTFQYQLANITSNVFLDPNIQNLGAAQAALNAQVGAVAQQLSLCPGTNTDCNQQNPGTWDQNSIVIQNICDRADCTGGFIRGDLAQVTVIFTTPFFRVSQAVGIDPLTMTVNAISGTNNQPGPNLN